MDVSWGLDAHGIQSLSILVITLDYVEILIWFINENDSCVLNYIGVFNMMVSWFCSDYK